MDNVAIHNVITLIEVVSVQITMNIPEELVHAIRLPEEEIPARLKIELAIRLYRKKILNFGKARELADMTYWDFYELLGKESIVRHYGTRELEEDLRTLEELA